MSSNPYKLFNHHLKTFFRELDKSFPTCMVFKIMLAGYKMIKTVNKKLPQKYFHEFFALPHGEHAKRRDDSSVFSDSYVPPALYVNLITEMKNLWKAQDTKTQSTIWDHIQVLLALNDKCIEYRKTKKMPPIETLSDDKIEDDEDD